MSERNALLHRRILEISGHEDACAAVRRSRLAEHERIVAAIAAGDRAAAERAVREHLGNVATVPAEVVAPEPVAL